jgi:hypothetical protein
MTNFRLHKRMVGRIGAVTVLGGFVLAFGGCVAPVDVLEPGGESEPLWDDAACDYEPDTPRTGDACDFPCEMPDTVACGGCTAQVDRCASRDHACDKSSTMRVSDTVLFDCDPATDRSEDRFNPDPSYLWSDCDEALSFGLSGEACAAPWTCARRTDDSCCVEVAACWSRNSGLGISQSLLRGRICSFGCEGLEPEPERPVAVECDGAFEGALRAGQPCTGDYVCLDLWHAVAPGDQTAGELAEGTTLSKDITLAPYLAPPEHTAQATAFHWCGNGVVQSGRFPFIMVD